MVKASKSECVVCGATEAYVTRTGANGGYGPALLPGLGRLFSPAKFDLRVCASCGHVAFFADAEMRRRMQASGKWTKAR